MKKVFYGLRASSELGNFFEENNKFSPLSPYILRVKNTFHSDDIAPFHCAKTIEILYCDNVSGTLTIDNKSFMLSGKQVFIIPPNVIHATSIFRCAGTQYVLQISVSDLGTYLNIPALLDYCGKNLTTLPYSCSDVTRVSELFEQLIQNDDDFILCVGILSELLSVILKTGIYPDSRSSPFSDNLRNVNNDMLRNVLDYTLENYGQKITIDEIASISGYSKHYFCNWFKALTGITYFTHLNNVRNMYACLLLKSGKSVTECCHSCGFGNISYFVQQFKKKFGITPLEYSLIYNQELSKNTDAETEV